MAVTKPSGRQDVLAAIAEFTYADYTSGTAEAIIALPSDAIVVGGHLVVTVAWDSATSATGTIGDTDDDDEYAAGIDMKSAALTALTPTGVKLGAGKNIVFKVTDVGAPGAGAARLVVEYVRDGRECEIQD
jgi:hypothetical protein